MPAFLTNTAIDLVRCAEAKFDTFLKCPQKPPGTDSIPQFRRSQYYFIIIINHSRTMLASRVLYFHQTLLSELTKVDTITFTQTGAFSSLPTREFT